MKIIRFFIILICVGIIIFIFFFLKNFEFRKLEHTEELYASSVPKGNYKEVIHHVANKLNQKYVDDTIATCLKLIEVPTTGSRETIDQITKGSVDIGIIQANAPIKSDHCGVIAKLYDEYFFIFSTVKNLNKVSDIKRQRRKIKIGCLGKGSQTLEDVKTLLDYFEIKDENAEIVPCNYVESFENIENGAVDIVILITAKLNDNVKKISALKNVHLVEIDNPKELITHYQFVETDSLAKNEINFGFPKSTYHTISVPALLIGGTKKNNIKVYNITKKLFSKKAEIENGLAYLNIDTIPRKSNLPIHQGTIDYFKKESPLWVEYENFVEFLLAIFGGLVSFITLYIEVKKYRRDG